MSARLAVYKSLAIVHLDGFENTAPVAYGVVDKPGSANWFCEQYGLTSDFEDDDAAGILWTDYGGPGWEFSALIQTREVAELTEFAREAGYTIDKTEDVSEPTRYGDGGGTVAICQHPDGWVVLS